MKTASNLLLVQDGLALAVSRRDDPTKWGLPGGKVDPHEASQQAAIREAWEETGLVIYQHEVTPILSALSTGDVDYWTTTYLFIGKKRFIEAELQPEEGLSVKWMTLEDLANPTISPFAEYNRWVQRQYNLYTKEHHGS